MDIQAAIEKAQHEVTQLFASDNPKSMRLEEVDMGHHSNWIITLSYLRQSDPDNNPGTVGGLMAIAAALNSQTRIYKTVVLEKSSGNIESIKMHKNG